MFFSVNYTQYVVYSKGEGVLVAETRCSGHGNPFKPVSRASVRCKTLDTTMTATAKREGMSECAKCCMNEQKASEEEIRELFGFSKSRRALKARTVTIQFID